MEFRLEHFFKSLIICFLLFGTKTFAQAESFKVGLILPLSGPLAPFGVAIKNAIGIAKSELAPETERKINFIFEDSQYDSKLSVSAFNKLRTNDKVNLVYVWGTSPASATAPIAENFKFPLVTMTGAEEVAAEKEYVIDFIGRISDFSFATLAYARFKKYKRFGFLKMETQYLETLSNGIENALIEGESVKIISSFPADNNFDVNSLMPKINNSIAKNQFDVLGVFVGTGPLATFYQKKAQYNISIPTFGSDYFGDETEMKNAGRAAVGSFYATPKISKTFLDVYSPKYGTTAITYAGNAYDFTKMIYSTFVDDTKKLASNDILTKFSEIKDYSGACGKYVFENEDTNKFKNPGKRFKSEIVIKEIIEGGISREVDFLVN